MEVDWAGSTAFIIDRDTGEKVKDIFSLQHYRSHFDRIIHDS